MGEGSQEKNELQMPTVVSDSKQVIQQCSKRTLGVAQVDE